ncbi:NAD(P)H-dependent oxidoreductase subunit E [Bacillota bacterium Meth-B3]|nr:NAD(P)H-dependent oxidoreductase subunit E [Christensenellaceae bacterium]MEA5065488.1 NAD(P)H-dependent oxidoreductase subunit E [Eubacteriales bacterium]MEA5068240.1 NAD(P)H-dependent oxidoreductase subunit E [Christensenellaceae bacterium]
MQAKCTCPGTEHEKALAQIANVIDLYKGRTGSLIQVLHLAQQIYGSLPLEVQMFISKEMEIPLSEISGVVSFYSFFSTVPRGQHTIRVCLGTACYVRGGKRVLEGLLAKLGVELGGTTQDGRFTLEVARCIGACGLAPAMMIDDEVYKQVNVNKLESILTKY